MNEQHWIDRLEKEGFKHAGISDNKPDLGFGKHIHVLHTAHVILEGELIITENGKNTTYQKVIS